jgi:hypothetical protein
VGSTTYVPLHAVRAETEAGIVVRRGFRLPIRFASDMAIYRQRRPDG